MGGGGVWGGRVRVWGGGSSHRDGGRVKLFGAEIVVCALVRVKLRHKYANGEHMAEGG